MSIQIIERNGWLHAKISRPRGMGRALCHSLHTKSMDEAKAKVKDANLEQISTAAAADALTRDVWTRLLAGRKILVRDAIKAYGERRHIIGNAADTTDKIAAVLDQFVRHTGIANASISVLESAHVSDFVNRPGRAVLNTRSWWLAILNSWLNFCVEQRWVMKNATVDVKVRLDGLSQEQMISHPHTPFTDEEVRMLLRAVPRADFWHGAILFGYHVGLRIGSVALLEDTNIVAYELRVYTQKGRRIVHERLPDDLIAWIEEWKTLRPSSETSFLFPAQAATYLACPALLSKQFKRLLTKHGIENRVFHSLRKTATARRWSEELEKLGDQDRRALMAMVSQHGFKQVQKMLAHAPGSDVTERHYLPQT